MDAVALSAIIKQTLSLSWPCPAFKTAPGISAVHNLICLELQRDNSLVK